MNVQTRICAVCNTVHDLPLCPPRRSEEKSAQKKRSRRAVDATPEQVAKFERAVKAFTTRQNATPTRTESDDSLIEKAAFKGMRGRL